MENWNWTKIFLSISFFIFLGSLLLRQESAITQDLGRHLRLGEMIIEGGPPNGEASDLRKCALYSNCLTYTYPDYPFINHHWGSEVIFHSIYKWAGFSGIIIFKAVILGLAFWITVIHALTANRYPLTANDAIDKQAKSRLTISDSRLTKNVIAIAITFLSIQMMADRLTTRPEIFGYLFFSLIFFILSRSNIKCCTTFYILPIIMLLWVNLHISFVFGLVLIWAWSGTKMLRYRLSVVARPPGLRPCEVGQGYQLQVNQFSVSQSETDRQKTGKPETENRKLITDNRLTLIILVVSTLVTFLNPSGFRGALMPLSILKDYGYTIVENMTPFFLTAFKPQPEYWIYIILLISTIVLLLFSSIKKNPFHLFTFLTFSLFPLIAVRHLPFFALMIPPVLAPLLYGVLKGPALRRKAGPYPILIVGCLLLLALTNPTPLAYGKLPPVGLTANSRHDPAIEFVKQNNLQGKIWNNYDIGSFLEWAIPQHKTFVDGRPEAFPVGFFQKTYIPMQENKEIWDRVTAEYDIQWIFAALTDSTPWFIKWWKMIRGHDGWRIVYFDNYTVILVRAQGDNNLIEPQDKAKLLKMPGLD